MKPTLAALLLTAISFLGSSVAQEEEVSSQDRLIVETIQKIENYDLKKAPDRVKGAVGRYLKAIEGSEEYLKFIERFELVEQAPGLLKLAKEKGGDSVGIKAVDLLAKFGQWDQLAALVAKSEQESALKLIAALGLSTNKEATPRLLSWATKKENPLAAELRQAAVQALAKRGDGPRALVAVVTKGELPDDLKFAAGNVLYGSGDENLISQIDKLLPRPKSAGNKPLPPVSELAKRKGKAANGKTVYMKLCIACHQVGGEGIDFGPALTEIGDKLAREGMFTAILDPNAAVSFGYEGFTVEMKDGSQSAGFVASDTEATLTLKAPGGISVPLDKSKIKKKTAMKQSLMPPGLQASMTEQELVDLVEYLTTLKK